MNFRKNRSRSRRNSINFMINTEKWKSIGRHPSQREDQYTEEDESEDEDKLPAPETWEEEFFSFKKLSEGNIDQDVEVQLNKKQTLLLSTLVPDEILRMESFDTSEPKRFVGVLLMADVSGYTVLSERYNNTGKGGPYRLTVTLNTYLGALIELIYSHGGDILKFAGDAFLAFWKTDNKTFLCHTIHTAIACALIIQHSYSSYETDVKVNLKVKLAISAGNLFFSPIGTKIPMNYVIFGLPVIEAKKAESLCASGEVKVTPNAWGHCYSRNYDHVIHEDGHVTIKSILYDPHDADVTKPFAGFGNMVRQIKKPFICAIENLPDSFFDSTITPSTSNAPKKQEVLGFRPTILLAEEKNIGSQIRKFMIRPILTQIDAHQPLEYLTEMRQVSVVFITLKPKKCPFLQLITIVNNSYQITCEIVYKSMGCVNKIILFDKDIMILVIFGLRGFKHEAEAQAALKCAYSIKKSVSALDGVKELSIGVTTGQVYCGVVGHPLRREFTVIGAIVNKAARLMCRFHNMITCDEPTYVKSKISTNNFTLQPKTELKGIGQPGKIYEYTEAIRVKELYDIPTIPLLLDRYDEMEYFKNWLDDSHLSYRDFDALLLIGESRLGKSRLLEWMARDAKNSGYKVCSINLTTIHSATPYLALGQIFDQILGLKKANKDFEKEEKIVQLLKVYNEDLCYLNNIIKVRFAYHEGIYAQDESKRNDKAKVIFTKLIDSISEVHILFLDDLQNLDPSSWEFISLMINSLKIFTVLSVSRGKFSSVHSWLYNVFIASNIRKIVLGPLKSSWIPPLACQILDVSAVPSDLCDSLRMKCKGLPGLVELFIVHLFSTGALELKKIKDDELAEWENEKLQFPDPKLLQPQALNANDQQTLNDMIENDKTGEIGICIVTCKEELNTDINVQNVDALIMIQIDSLTPYQQLLLKISSVIGNVLPRDLLESIMYENNPLTTAKAIKRLFAMKIFTCANSRKWLHTVRSNQSLMSITSKDRQNSYLTCECVFEYDAESSSSLPKYAFCKLMKFKSINSRKTCYELLPMNQKKEFHSRIVNYLETKNQKCPDCGGALIIAQATSDLKAADYRMSKIDDINEISKFSQESDDEFDIEDVVQEPSVKSQRHKDSKRSNSEVFPKKEYYIDNFGKMRSRNASLQSLAQSEQTILSTMQYNSILKSKLLDGDITPGSRRSTKRVTIPNLFLKDYSFDRINNSNVFDMMRALTEAEKISEWHDLGVIDSDDDAENNDKNDTYYSIKIERGVSQTNFIQCTCAEVNIAIYEQLTYHANKADLKSRQMEFLIKLCHLYISANNIETALERLEEAESSCSLPENKEIISSFDIRRFMGKIYSLKAAAYLMSENLTESKLAISRATRIYRFNLHKASGYFKIRKLFNVAQLKRRKYRIRHEIMTSDSVFCLNVATLLYSTLGDINVARVTAYRALDLVQKVNCNVVDMCDAFSNALQMEIMIGLPDSTAHIEKIASYSLQHLTIPIQANELYAVGKLFMSAFRARIARAQLAAGIRAGFRAIAVSRFLHADTVTIDILPDLFYALLSRRRIEEAIDVINETLRMGQNRVSFEYETWYYALCIDLILDAGVQLETPNEISRYAEFGLSRSKVTAGRRRLVVGLWTYCLRTDLEKKAKLFETEALSWAAKDDDDASLNTLISAMRLAEGMLESLARKIDDLRKVVDLMQLRSLADRELSKLENDARECRAVYPRWILLKANSHNLSGRYSAAVTTLNQALEESRKSHNRLEEAAALAATSNSSIWLQSAHAGRFLSWREGVLRARTSWHQLLYKISATR